MAQSRLSAKNDVGIGTRSGDLGAWEKLQLGWLDYEIAVAGQKRTYKMGPHEYNSRKAQGLGGRAAQEGGRPPSSPNRTREHTPGGAAPETISTTA